MALVVEDLALQRREDRIPFLSGLAFTLSAGRTVALCGPSGSGKTSVALSILDLLPSGLMQVKGSIALDGDTHRAAWRGRHIGLMFQDPRRAFHPMYSVGQLFAERLDLAGIPRREQREETLRWLKRVDLAQPESRLGDRVWQFSGGELQRIMLAMILAQGPRYLLADEPTSSLDVLIQGRILRLLKRLQEELKLGILLITHDAAVARVMEAEPVLMGDARPGEKT